MLSNTVIQLYSARLKSIVSLCTIEVEKENFKRVVVSGKEKILVSEKENIKSNAGRYRKTRIVMMKDGREV